MRRIIFYIFTIIIVSYPILREYRILSFDKLDYRIYVFVVIIYLIILCRILTLEHKNERKFKLLEKQELLLRKFALKVEYQCKLNNGDNAKETSNGEIHGRRFFASLNEDKKHSPEKILKLQSKIPIYTSFLSKKDIVVKVDFYPMNEIDILNKPINILEKYKEILIPFGKVLKLIGKNHLIKDVKIDTKVIINNKLMIHEEEKLTSSDFKEGMLILEDDNGIFKDIEKKYLS